MGRRNDLNKPTKDQIIEEYSKPAATISSVARAFGTTNPTVRKWMIEYEIMRKSHADAIREVKSTGNLRCPDVSTLISMTEAGKSLASIMRHFDVSRGQALIWLDEAGLHVMENKYCRKEVPSKEEISSLLDGGKTYQEICDILSVSYPTLMRWIDDHGLKRNVYDKYRIMTSAISKKKMELYGYPHFPESVYENVSASDAELRLKEYVRSFVPDFKRTFIYGADGSRFELDMCSASRKIAIEYSGAYWHSEIFKDKNYHFKKWQTAKDNGIHLMTFWDLEYQKRQEQVDSFIRAKLGVFTNRLYARNLDFVEVSHKLNDFFELNHIQGGGCKIDRNFALVHDGRIVGAISYAHHHRNNEIYTLNRLAFERDLQIVGGVGKLIANSLDKIETDVVTWSDNRYSTGAIYEANGFVFDKSLPPDYCYYDKKGRLYSKQSQMKSAIGCPPDMTEKEFCETLGRYRLWDCGKRRYVFKK